MATTSVTSPVVRVLGSLALLFVTIFVAGKAWKKS